MRELQLPYFQKARLWINDFPKASYVGDLLRQFSLKTIEQKNKPSLSLSVELMSPKGARIMYGLLGLNYLGDSSERLEVSLPLCTRVGSVYEAALLGSLEAAYIGLPSEYAEGVAQGLEVARVRQPKLPVGKLDFQYAAHSLAGSSPVMFKHLTFVLCYLLSEGNVDDGEGEVSEDIVAVLSFRTY